ncbi:energy transducer TonB [Stutzerimonas tarimensis]|uniref:Energy transducer TonB n=1 Tax=Stutzerimonas tarimensis TaxID=1507735 RepID=A0ABV7TC51_9GAMM
MQVSLTAAGSVAPSPTGQRTGFGLGQGFMVSLLLHGALLTPWLLRDYLTAPPPSQEQLVVELFGMVSARQVEERVAGADIDQPAMDSPPDAPPPPPPSPEAPPPPPPPPPEEPREMLRESPAPSPVQVEPIAEPQPPAPKPPAPSPDSSSTPPTPTPRPVVDSSAPQVRGAEEQQQQQTLRNQDAEADALRRYLAELKRAIQSHLDYPAEARRAGQVGVPVVSFRLGEDGYIQAGSLQVRRSSGYSLLDRKALEAAKASAPFERPPRAMEVAIAVSFVQERPKN